jgi:hypothetical protein
LLWTGGWDSTFRLLQALFEEGSRVETMYVLSERPSRKHELDAMRAVRLTSIERLGSDDLFPPTVIHDSGQFVMSRSIEEIWEQAQHRVHVARQYKYLANIAEQLGWSMVEMCLQRNEGVDFKAEIFGFTPKSVDHPPLELTDSPLSSLFRFWTFPTIGLSKMEMVELAQSGGYGDILSMSWFCGHPLRGEPCGYCRPCELAKASGRPHQFSRWGFARKTYRRSRTSAALAWRRATNRHSA